MINNRQNGRRRGRGGERVPNAPNRGPNPNQRPDNRARGNAAQLHEKYKALAGLSTTSLFAYVSADGLRWRKLRDHAVVKDTDWVFDSQNVAFWSETEKQYVVYYRRTVDGIRSIARATCGSARTAGSITGMPRRAR